MTRTCVRCSQSILSARACMPCVAEIRAKFGRQRTVSGGIVTWEHETQSSRGGELIHRIGDSYVGVLRIPMTMRPATFFYRRLEIALKDDGLTARSGDEDLAPVRRLIAEWAHRMGAS